MSRPSKLHALLAAGCLGAAGVATIPALAVGASPPPPTVASAPATGVTNSGASLNGTVNPNGQQTSYAMQWGPTTGYGHETPLTSAGSGSAVANVAAAVSGLNPGSGYHFRVIAINASGTSVGADESFSTSGTAPAPSPAPLAATGDATNVTGSAATLNGTETPSGQATQYYYEYGPTANYGYETPPQSAASSTTPGAATATLSNLQPTTTYHYRLVAVNPGGTALGTDRTFTTATLPSATTERATQLSVSSARVNGVANPNGQSTSYFFQYGPTSAYGLQTRPIDIGSGSSVVAVHRTLGDLTPGATYHYRLVSESSAGTSYGADMTFSLAPAQSKVAFMGHMGFVSPGSVIGVEAGCFGGDTTCNGHVTMSTVGSNQVLAQRNFSIPAHSGGFENVKLSPIGQRLLKNNGVWRLLQVEVDVTTTTGQSIHEPMSLARWVWH